jgi:hypothetical protein
MEHRGATKFLLAAPRNSGVSAAAGALVLAAVWAGCASDEQNATADSDGPVAVSPRAGEWVAPGLRFTVEGTRITELEFGGFGCVGGALPGGSHTCESLLRGPLEVDIAPDALGQLSWDGGFGLQIVGAFLDAERFAGGFSYAADNGCCSSEATLEALHEDIAEDEQPAPCESDIDGSEELIVGLTLGGAFVPLAEGAPVPAVAGLQGAIMVVLGLRTEAIALGGLVGRVSVVLPGSGVSGDVVASIPPFVDRGDGAAEWLEVWVVLTRDGTPLSPTNAADVSLIDGHPVEVSAEVSNPCGLSLVREHVGSLEYP